MNLIQKELHYTSLYLEMFFIKETETLVASGTGFLVPFGGTTYLITNRHNVTGTDFDGNLLSKNGSRPNQIRVHCRKSGEQDNTFVKKINLYETQEIIDADKKWYEHPNTDYKIDCVAIKMPDVNGMHLSQITLKNHLEFEKTITDIVSVIGYPFGLKSANNGPIWATGYIATDPKLNYDNKPMFLIDCRSRKGQSGSPVISYNNLGMEQLYGFDQKVMYNQPTFTFLGIYSGRINSQSDLGIVWKESAIIELLESIS